MDNKSYSFWTDDAVKWKSADAAAILFNLRFWLDHNKANHKPEAEHNLGICHVHDDRVWTYNSHEAWSKLFPWMSVSQIKRQLKKLEEGGLLIKGNYNKNKFDKTVWYSLDEPAYRMAENDQNKATAPETTDVTKSSHPLGEIVSSTRRNRPISTDKKPNEKLLNNNPTEQSSLGDSFDFDLVLLFVMNTLRESGVDVDGIIEKALIKSKVKEYQNRYPKTASEGDALSYVLRARENQHSVKRGNMVVSQALDNRSRAKADEANDQADKISHDHGRDRFDRGWAVGLEPLFEATE